MDLRDISAMGKAATLDGMLERASAADMVLPHAAPSSSLAVSATTTHSIEEVEPLWRRLEAQGIESPGQSFDFIRQWIAARRIPATEQLYVVGSVGGQPVALLPLHRHRMRGIRLYSWFPGSHVGCGAPLIDRVRFAALGTAARAAFWKTLFSALKGADLVYLRAVPEMAYGLEQPFAELGRWLPTETLYRASFSSWEQANTTQRSKSRRKHDRQQGERLEAMGAVSFAVVEGDDPAAPDALDAMFRQRAVRFKVMGVDDPFCSEDIARFYDASVEPGSKMRVKLHVLRLDGAIVAVRYNIVHGDRLFCLISSMSDDPKIQVGSPGKQCLLRVMQTVFDEGYRVFDMGGGFTDEKRHWCNEQIGLRSHYLPLTLLGHMVIEAHSVWLSLRSKVKDNVTLLKWAKAMRTKLRKVPAVTAAESEQE
jgi:CelD/BcsL family acetyltransferase involved in cellulose biosynthesis